MTLSSPIELAYYDILREVENGPKVGWDNNRQLWFPHASIEGGEPTIAYGHKLSDLEHRYGAFSDGISQVEALELLIDDVSDARKIVRKNYPYASISEKYLYVLVDVAFNTGNYSPKSWPKLTEAIKNGNEQEIFRQSLRWYTNQHGRKLPLLKRTVKVSKALGLKFNENDWTSK